MPLNTVPSFDGAGHVSPYRQPTPVGGTTATSVTVDANGNVPVAVQPAPAGANTPTWIQNVSGAAAIKAAAGNLLSLSLSNVSGAATWVQIFDALVGGVALGTTAPVLEFYVPSAGVRDVPAPPGGWVFANGITIAATTGEKGNTGAANGVIASVAFA